MPPTKCKTCHTIGGVHINGTVNVDFSASDPPNPAAIYQNLTCSGVYCHSNGRSPTQTGTASWNADTQLSCTGCHTSQLSGRHQKHAQEGIACQECHNTVKNSTTVVDFNRHVDGKKDYTGPLSRVNNSCSGTCHGQTHEAEQWQ